MAAITANNVCNSTTNLVVTNNRDVPYYSSGSHKWQVFGELKVMQTWAGEGPDHKGLCEEPPLPPGQECELSTQG